MISYQKVRELIDKRVSLNPDDPRVLDIWEELTNIFSQDENETVNFLKKCTIEDIRWISEVFDDILENLQGKIYIEEIERWSRQWPELVVDVEYAKSMMD